MHDNADYVKCPECGGTGVIEIQSSGDRETGFDREWDTCPRCEDARRESAVVQGSRQ